MRIPGGFTGSNIEDMIVLYLTTTAGPLDLAIIPAGTAGYSDLACKASDLPYRGVLVRIADLEDVAR